MDGSAGTTHAPAAANAHGATSTSALQPLVRRALYAALRAFALAYGVRAAVSLLLRLPSVLRKPYGAAHGGARVLHALTHWPRPRILVRLTAGASSRPCCGRR